MSGDPRDSLYRQLMIDPSADDEIITVVYRRLARRFHPDIDPSPAAAVRMREINAAREILSDPVKRAKYDSELKGQRDRRTTDRLIRRQDEVIFGDAGVPVGPPTGTMLEFGRYAGWTLGQIRRHDPNFLEWLMHMPAGRQYREEIKTLLARR